MYYNNARFAAVDAENPEFWEWFEHFTLYMIGKGFKHYSARAVFDRVRWETAQALDDGTSYKIGNNWSPWYSRKFHRLHPEHVGFFRCRIAKADMDEEDGELMWT
jgi:hypothetical protein